MGDLAVYLAVYLEGTTPWARRRNTTMTTPVARLPNSRTCYPILARDVHTRTEYDRADGEAVQTPTIIVFRSLVNQENWQEQLHGE